MGHNLRAVDDKALFDLRVIQDINGLLNAIKVFFQMVMQIDPHRRRGNAFTRTNKKRVIQLRAQALQGLAHC